MVVYQRWLQDILYPMYNGKWDNFFLRVSLFCYQCLLHFPSQNQSPTNGLDLSVIPPWQNSFHFSPLLSWSFFGLTAAHVAIYAFLVLLPVGWLVVLGFNPFPYNDTFWRPWETSLLKTLWEKEKLLVRSNLSFTHSLFSPFRELSAIFIKFKIVICRLFQFGLV